MILNAIMCVWNEEDIIYSSVRHAFAQGCSNVYIIDNNSGDKTIQQAVRAGAVYCAKFKTDVFDETRKTVYLNKYVAQINESLPGDKHWWLYVDADEFPCFNDGRTLLEHLVELEGADASIRAIKGFHYNHLPTHAPYMRHGTHPADCQPLAVRAEVSKYPLLRHDKFKPMVYSGSGAHTYNAESGRLAEAERHVLIHHFNYRTPAITRMRLEALVLPNARGKSRVERYDAVSRLHNQERSMYHDRLERLEAVYVQNHLRNLVTELLPYDYKKLTRWYDSIAGVMDEKAMEGMGQVDFHIWKGTHLFFMGHYDIALCAFNDALAKAEDNGIRERLALAVGRCFLRMSDPGACINAVKGPLRSTGSQTVRDAAESLIKEARGPLGDT